MPAHTAVFPETAPGCAGNTVAVTDNICGVLLPQLLLAVTEILPPAAPVVTIIELVMELPVHPAGNDQAYEVAPLIAATE